MTKKKKALKKLQDELAHQHFEIGRLKSQYVELLQGHLVLSTKIGRADVVRQDEDEYREQEIAALHTDLYQLQNDMRVHRIVSQNGKYPDTSHVVPGIAHQDGSVVYEGEVDAIISNHQHLTNTDIGKMIGCGVTHQWVTAYKLFHEGWKK